MLLPLGTKANLPVDTVQVVSERWEDSTETDGSGLFFDIIREVYRHHQMAMEYGIMPYKRSILNVQRRKADIAVGVYPNEVDDVIYPKLHFFVDDISAVRKLGDHLVWEGEKSLENKNVMWLLGYSYDKYLNAPLRHTHEVINQDTALRLMDANRFDYYIGPAVMIEPELDPQTYEMLFIKWIKMYVIFQQSERGEHLAKLWDEGLQALLEDGTVRSLYEKYGLIEYYQFDDN